MKKILIVVLFVMSCGSIFAQEKKAISFITRDELVGTWQKGSKVVGSGMNQNFALRSSLAQI